MTSQDDQTDIRWWISSLKQGRRMFGHHRDSDQPEEPGKKLGNVTEEELDELEEEFGFGVENQC